MATYFTSKGVRPGDVVAVDFTNKVILAHIWMGLSAIGASPAFINYSVANEALQNCVKISGAKLLVVDPDVLEKVAPLQQAIDDMGVETVLFDDDWLQRFNQLPLDTPSFEPKGIKGTDMACIFYTRQDFCIQP
jgi:acyl-coenzyme A synthetase/AMP-(fatty) acid ligase